MQTLIFPTFAVASGVFLFSLGIFPLLRHIGIRKGFVDNPLADSLKIHKKPIPYLGGFGVLSGLFLASGLLAGFFPWLGDAPVMTAVLILATLAWLFGFFDDIKWQKRSTHHLAVKIASQIFLSAVMSIGIGWPTLPSLAVIFAYAFAYLLLINASNMQDGLDGLLAGVTLISALGIGALALIWNQPLALAVTIALTASCSAFLFFNFNPASIFLGDNGSYTLGSLIAFSLYFLHAELTAYAVLGLALIVGMPLVNVFFVSVRRVRSGQSPLVGDRCHIYDILHRALGSVKKAVLSYYGMQFILVLLGFIVLMLNV